MHKIFNSFIGVLFLALIPQLGMVAAEEFDLAINNGRVMDPESGLDAIRHIGIIAGRVVSISEQALEGERVIDAEGLVVAPGFVDIHEHGQSEESYRLMVQDGVTSAFELEVGTAMVADWYNDRAGGQLLNYGISVGHIPIRMTLFNDGGRFLPTGAGGSAIADRKCWTEWQKCCVKVWLKAPWQSVLVLPIHLQLLRLNLKPC